MIKASPKLELIAEWLLRIRYSSNLTLCDAVNWGLYSFTESIKDALINSCLSFDISEFCFKSLFFWEHWAIYCLSKSTTTRWFFIVLNPHSFNWSSVILLIRSISILANSILLSFSSIVLPVAGVSNGLR